MVEYLLCVVIAGLGWIFVAQHEDPGPNLGFVPFYVSNFVIGSIFYGLIHLALWGWSKVMGG